MNDKTKQALAYLGIGIAGILVGALVVWGVTGSSESPESATTSDGDDKVAELEARVTSLTAQVTSLEGDLSTTQQELADARAAAASGSNSSGSGSSSSSSSSGSSSSGSSSAATEKQFCYITKVVWEGATPQITVDYAQLLMGAEAEAAAIAAGEEPLDWYIKNENTKLRTFPADPSKNVTLVSTSDGVNPAGYTVNFGQWVDAYAGVSGGLERIADSAYYITISGGKIVKIEEVYFP